MLGYKRKWIPVEPYEIGALESWFSDMAAEGLQLYSANTVFATFKETEEKRFLYHLEPKEEGHGDKPPSKQIEFHKNLGWEYVTFIGNYFYIYAAETGTPRPYTDPSKESALYKKYSHKEGFWNLDFAVYIIYTLLIIAVILKEIALLKAKGTYRLVTTSILPFGTVLPLIFSMIPSKRLRGMRRIQKALAAGESQHHEGDWTAPFLHWKHRLFYISIVCMFASFYLPLLPYALSYSDKPVAELKHPLPMISLAEIENDPDFYYVDTYYQRDNSPQSEWWERESGMAYSEISIGAPTQIAFNQAGCIDGKFDDHGYPYASVLWVDYMKLSPFVSPKEYLDEYFAQSWRQDTTRYTYTVLENTPFDYAVLAEGREGTELFIVSGQKLLELSYYYGDADLTAHYNLYEEVLKQDYHR